MDVTGWDSEFCRCGCGYFMGVLTPQGSPHQTAWDRPAAEALLRGLPPETHLSAHSGLADYGALEFYPTHVDTLDSFILWWLVDENQPNGLKALSERYLHSKMDDPISVPDAGPQAGQTLFHGVHICDANQAEVEAYCRADSRGGADLTLLALARISKGALKWFYAVEQPLDRALWKVNRRGVGVDVPALNAEIATLAGELPVLEKAVYAAAGYEFLLTSTLELRNVLYSKEWVRKQDHRGLVGYLKTCEHKKELGKCKVDGCEGLRPKYGWKSQTYGGQSLRCFKLTRPRNPSAPRLKSTDEEALLPHAGNPVVDAILDYRESLKISQFLASWSSHLVDGRLFCRMTSAGTVTGRFSHRDPNLAQVPKRGSLGKRMRALFVPANPTNVLVVCDQDAVEARLAASFAREDVELERFRRGEDVHQALADDMGCSRDAGKTTRYTIVFGGAGRRVASTLTRYGFPTATAQGEQLVDDFFAALPKLLVWKGVVERAATSTGRLSTLGGRTRHLYDAMSGNLSNASRALRQAVASVIQGSASDLTKLWMVKLEREGVPMILSVHDEVLVECSPEDAPMHAATMERCLQEAGVELGVRCPITGTAYIVSKWSEKG